jgi:hypothetical protein
MATRTSVWTASRREPAVFPRINGVNWMSKPRPGGVPGGVKKILTTGTGGGISADPDFTFTSILNHIPPWWRDDELVYHPCVEEAFIVNGTVQLADRVYEPGSYVYRPPGILHGPAFVPSDIGATLFQRFAAEGGILRYEGDEFPHADLQPVTDEYQRWPVEWVEHVDSNELPAIPVGTGPWAGATCKWLTRNRETGGGTILLDLPPYWTGSGSPGRGTVEEFVVSGEMTIGGQFFERWGYACRPAGEPAGSYGSQGGARLLCIWDEDELGA